MGTEKDCDTTEANVMWSVDGRCAAGASDGVEWAGEAIEAELCRKQSGVDITSSRQLGTQ